MSKPRLRSSERDRVLSCNGSITLVPMVNPRDGGEGWEGSYIHWSVADRAIRELGAIPPEGGLPPPDVPKGYELPSNSLWIVEWCMNHLREHIPADWSLMVEVEFEHEYDRWIGTGHADIVALSPCATKAKGIDWKSVRDPVDPADENWQVFDYQCHIKLAWPTVTECEFHICQPRVTEIDAEEAAEDGVEEVSRVSISNLNGDRLEAAPATMDMHVCAALDNSMELNSSKKACNWCPVGCQCPALQADQKLMKIQMTPEMLAKISKTPDDALLGDWVVTARTLNRATKDAEALLHKRLDETGVVVAGNGTTITRKIEKGSYTILEPVKLFKAAKELLTTDERIAACFKPSMSAMVGQVAEACNVPKSGKSAVTGQAIVDAQIKPFTRQGERRILQFS
jgi:hypothetical protein